MNSTVFRIVKGFPTLDDTQWGAVLYLSTIWKLDSVRILALEKLNAQTHPPLRRIELALKCNVQEWLGPAYSELCSREESITLDEARTLEIDCYHILVQIREQYKLCRFCKLCSADKPDHPDIKTAIQNSDLAKIERYGACFSTKIYEVKLKI